MFSHTTKDFLKAILDLHSDPEVKAAFPELRDLIDALKVVGAIDLERTVYKAKDELADIYKMLSRIDDRLDEVEEAVKLVAQSMPD